ncbi:MAG: metallophosphoesterase [Nitrososphaerota archaeon]|nr:metallophosphoesterase [Nitrososphaerota archaeon]MDG7024582.1 metallophosphoesterase [Nitrososphaerota archaeon]
MKIVPGDAALVFIQEGESTLLISDLHLGLEKEMAKKGFRLPAYSVRMVDRIRDIADRYHTRKLAVLGDVKHAVGKVEDIDWGVIPWFFDTMLDLFESVEVVPGNHDGSIKTVLPQRVVLHQSQGTVLGKGRGKVGVAHGHAWPSEEAIKTRNLVIGHSHFTYEMRDSLGSRTREAVWVTAQYDVAELMEGAGYSSKETGRGKLTVMPPFNRLVGGQPINRSKSFQFGPVLSSRSVSLDDADIFLTDGTRVT